MRSKVLLLLAILMGGITTFLFYSYMNQAKAAAASGQVVKMVNVVTAKKAIVKNQKLSADMLELVKKPEEGLHPDTIHKINDAVGQFATTNLAQGEILLSDHLKKKQDESVIISRKISQTMRAVSIGVNDVESVSNLIEPDDHVDVLFSDKKHTTELLSDVNVLAVGQKMVPDNDTANTTQTSSSQNSSASPSQKKASYTSVTLEVSPGDAIKLVDASRKGTLQLMLHSSIVPSH